jgi:hypothetical protein
VAGEDLAADHRPRGVVADFLLAWIQAQAGRSGRVRITRTGYLRPPLSAVENWTTAVVRPSDRARTSPRPHRSERCKRDET